MHTITLSNGKKVGNFSSPHPFEFTDRSVLPAVSPELSKELSVLFNEVELQNGDVELTFSLTDRVLGAIQEWMSTDVDVVFCPLPMITAIKERLGREWLIDSPFRCVRIEDRINKLVSTDKQCI